MTAASTTLLAPSIALARRTL
ncbi:MAG: hypothetical protein QOF86_148, partial [Baekduia sp.]|nr:hypothetical protein [Baekduia sp.]